MDEANEEEPREEEPELYCDEMAPVSWVGFGRAEFPDESWQYLKDGTLVTREREEPVDLVTIDEFGDFELELQWRVSLGGNSGILYRVSEAAGEPWQSGPEMQIVDDLGHPDGRAAETSTGAVYGLIPPSDRTLRPAGTFNDTRIIARGDHVEHWLNGKKVVSYDLNSPEFTERVAASKFRDFPRFGGEKKGHIVLRHHGTTVWFKGIRIRRL
jgi:hypothetical protein